MLKHTLLAIGSIVAALVAFELWSRRQALQPVGVLHHRKSHLRVDAPRLAARVADQPKGATV
jgi:hypothetical protein